MDDELFHRQTEKILDQLYHIANALDPNGDVASGRWELAGIKREVDRTALVVQALSNCYPGMPSEEFSIVRNIEGKDIEVRVLGWQDLADEILKLKALRARQAELEKPEP